jgi:hypothetical protein
MALYVARDAAAFGFVAHAVLFLRACFTLLAGMRYAGDLRGVLLKHDTKIGAMAAAFNTSARATR